jgi:hypothetical protein
LPLTRLDVAHISESSFIAQEEKNYDHGSITSFAVQTNIEKKDA